MICKTCYGPSAVAAADRCHVCDSVETHLKTYAQSVQGRKKLRAATAPYEPPKPSDPRPISTDPDTTADALRGSYDRLTLRYGDLISYYRDALQEARARICQLEAREHV